MSNVVPIENYKKNKQSSGSINIGLPNIDNSTGEKNNKIDAFQIQELIKKLNKVFQECKRANWDNNGAEPISDSTFNNAINLLTVLPVDLPIPDVLADNDGYIEFEWYNLGKSFSLYVTDSNLILYAGFYGKDNRLSGRFNFEGFFSERARQFAADVYKEKTK
jgi:hypothetical protein